MTKEAKTELSGPLVALQLVFKDSPNNGQQEPVWLRDISQINRLTASDNEPVLEILFENGETKEFPIADLKSGRFCNPFSADK